MSSEDKKPTPIDDRINCSFEDIRPEYPVSTDDDGGKEDDTDKMLRFLCLIGRLKSQPRRGWILKNRDISNCEPIAGHMYRMAIMAMLFEDDDDDYNHQITNNNGAQNRKKLDINKIIRMSLLHDMAECVVGDITPFDGITVEEKHAKELDTMKKLTGLLPEFDSKIMLDLYTEYEAQESVEAKLVKEIDRYDFCHQAFQYEMQEYHNSGRIMRVEEAYDNAVRACHHPKLRRLLERLIEKRTRFWATAPPPQPKTSNGGPVLSNGDH